MKRLPSGSNDDRKAWNIGVAYLTLNTVPSNSLSTSQLSYYAKRIMPLCIASCFYLLYTHTSSLLDIRPWLGYSYNHH